MHFHLPRPLHGWREFAGEVGIVVLGVLIALGAGQVVEMVHDRQMAADARSNIRAEAAQNVDAIRDRLSTQACIDSRIAKLQDLLFRSGEGPLSVKPTWVSRPPFWPIFLGRWQAATASGRNSLFSPDEQGRFSQIYRVFTQYDTDQAREQVVWAQLRALEWWQGPLGPQARLEFAQALQQAKYLSWDLHYAGTYALMDAAEMHLPKRQRERSVHSICLPINEQAADALRKLKDPFGEP
jgi:hypothetical protein